MLTRATTAHLMEQRGLAVDDPGRDRRGPGGVTKEPQATESTRPSWSARTCGWRTCNGYLDLTEVTTHQGRPRQVRCDALRLEPGDVLFNEGGRPGTTGRGCGHVGGVRDRRLHRPDSSVFAARRRPRCVRLLDSRVDPRQRPDGPQCEQHEASTAEASRPSTCRRVKHVRSPCTAAGRAGAPSSKEPQRQLEASAAPRRRSPTYAAAGQQPSAARSSPLPSPVSSSPRTPTTSPRPSCWRASPPSTHSNAEATQAHDHIVVSGPHSRTLRGPWPRRGRISP